MKKLTLQKANDITFREGCEKYLDDCRVRNLREGTIGHYRQSYVQFYKYFDPDMPVSEFSEKHYNDYIMYLKEAVGNDQSINSYLRDLITTVHFWINQAWVKPFRMRTIKFDNVVTLSKLLGHSSLDITQDYIHLLVTDLGKEVKAMNLLDKFAPREAIKLKREEVE